MRTTFATLIVMAGIGAAASPAAAQAQKIAYLNSQAIIAETPGAVEAQTQIQQEGQRLQQRIQAFQDSMNTLFADYQRQSVLLSPEEKKRREEALGAKEQSFAQRAQILQQEAQTRQQEIMQPIMRRVEEVIEAVRSEGGYAIIFDTESAAIVSADTTLDLTNAIIARLKAQANGNSPSPNGGNR
jgi:outer membrane protein